ncbi:hypothetical protein MKW98_002241 [Papaver atlanticum]|uniref:Uncharacterized protein n=1 Tax=Papaver atlanticum TaxID=357466 RepID=A0AAD4X2U0_9MAGN|nr:hypothetical protein MKW98_002241 [Papaver atlanticum]
MFWFPNLRLEVHAKLKPASAKQHPSFTGIPARGGTTFNGVIHVSDDGGSTYCTNCFVYLAVQLLETLIRSRCLRLLDESASEALAVTKLLGHRSYLLMEHTLNQNGRMVEIFCQAWINRRMEFVFVSLSTVKPPRYDIVKGVHSLWNGVSKPYREIIRA